MTQEDFAQKLRTGVVVFSYKKKDGNLRHAKGTLKMALIPVADHPKSGSGSSAESSGSSPSAKQTYYDLDANGWRSFMWENFGDSSN